MSSSHARRRSRGAAAAVLGAAMFVLAPAVAAAAADAAVAPRPQPDLVADAVPGTDGGVEALGLEVAAAYEVVGDDTWLPVTVTLQPRRAVVADIEVTSTGAQGRQTSTRPIELRAGATAVYRFAVPNGLTEVTVRESAGQTTTVDVNTTARPDDTSMVAVIGSLDEGPPLQDAAANRAGAWTTLDANWLIDAPEVLAGLSAVVIDTDTLATLEMTARSSLAAAVVAGMDLVVVAPDPGPVRLDDLTDSMSVSIAERGRAGDLPVVTAASPAWTVTAADVGAGGDAMATVAAVAGHGRGRIAVTSAAPGVGSVGGSASLWSLLALGKARYQRNAEDFDPMGRRGAAADLADVLSEGRTTAPAIPWLGVFLMSYIVVVGPVNALILRRRKRRELAWITVPAITAVFTLAAILGVGGASPVRERAATTTWSVDGAGERVRLVAVRTPTQTTRTIGLDGADWAVQAVAGGPDGARIDRAGGTRVDVSLQSLAAGGVIATQVSAQPPPLDVQAVVRDGDVAVEVRNTGATAIDGVVVRLGVSTRPVGRVPPGGVGTATFAAGTLLQLAEYGPLPPAVDTGAGLDDVMVPEPGMVWVIGSLQQPQAQTRGRSQVVVGVRPQREEGTAVPGLVIDRALVADDGGYRSGPFSVEGGRAVLRLRYPPDVAGGTLVDELGGNNKSIEVWDARDRVWIERDRAFPGGRGDADRLLSPAGELYVRNAQPNRTFEYSARTVSALPPESAATEATR